MDGMEHQAMNANEASISSIHIGANFGFFYQQQNAIELLIAHQDEILDLFKHYRHSDSIKIKQNLRARLYLNLAIYAQIEDEVFYPAIKLALRKRGLSPDLQMTFDPLVELISQIDFQNSDMAMHDHNIVDLEKYFHYYVKVQREEMFVKAEKLNLNLAILGQKIHLRKLELLSR